MKLENNPKDSTLVSVCLISYNQAAFIKQAIEGVINQIVNFNWELIVADDCSTDGTKEILLDFKARYPTRIKLIFQTQNVGPSKNWLDLIAAPVGKYIAYFESDDYWTEPLKLQKQVNFLEENPDFTFAFHDVFEWKNGRDMALVSPPYKNETGVFTIFDIAKGNFIHTPSVVFRNIFRDGLPEWFGSSPVGDYVLYMLLAEKGKIKYFPEPMAVYRRHTGIWSVQSQLTMWKKWFKVLDLLKTHFRDHAVLPVLKKQETEIINEIISMTERLEKEVKALKTDPNEIAGKVTLKNLISAIRIKAGNLIRNKRRTKILNPVKK